MANAPVADDAEVAAFITLLDGWCEEWRGLGILHSMETLGERDDVGNLRWLVRFRGEEKDFITVWLTLRQRTVHVETQVMPAPEEHVEEVFRFALAKNADLYPLHLALGPEAGLYLVGRFPVAEVSRDLLDTTLGAAVRYADELFPTVMSLGLASLYRRRRRS